MEYSITEAARISHTFPLLTEAKAILDRLKDEQEVEEMLGYAVAAKDGAELERSIKAAELLGLEALWHTLAEVSFQWKNPDFLFKKSWFAIRNPDFLSKKC